MWIGALIYIALALISAVSILMKRPWTILVARRNYPPEIQSTPLFLETNQVLTGLWTLVFIAAALVAYAVSSVWVYVVAFVFMFVLARVSNRIAVWYVGYRTSPGSA